MIDLCCQPGVTKVCTVCLCPHHETYSVCQAHSRHNSWVVPLRPMTDAELAAYLIGGHAAVEALAQEL